MSKKFKPPYFGAAYYPEAWPIEQIDTDLDIVLSYGMNTVRVGEFAWYTMEPQEGKYDLSLFRTVVDKCAQRGISVIMCTPSATLPAWMEYKYPEVCSEVDGHRTTHGTRRMSCPTSPILREKIKGIVEVMAKEFANDENIIGWQIDNEISASHSRCTCKQCLNRYHIWLKEKYGTIENLNKAWGNYTWSMAYSDFDEVSSPSPVIWNNATHQLAWGEYKNDIYAEFIQEQADILHQYVHVPVGTDLMLTQDLDIAKANRPLDISQFNHYNGPDYVGLWMAVYRGIHKRKFWVTETATYYNGSNQSQGPRMPGFCRANTLKAFANGAEANLYWLLRAHYAGHEIAHGSVVDAWGRETPVADEIKQLGKDIELLTPMICTNRTQSGGVAVMYTHLSDYLRRFQPLVTHAKDLGELAFGNLEKGHFAPDALTADADLSSYKMIVSAGQYTLDEEGFAEKLYKWIQSGGTWVVGPLTDVLTNEATRYMDSPLGHLEKWTGLYRKYFVPAPHEDDRYAELMPVGKITHIKCSDGLELTTLPVGYDAFEIPQQGETIGVYEDGDPFLNGYAAIVETQVGKGKIIVLGAQLDESSYIQLLTKVAHSCGIEPITSGSTNAHCTLLEGNYGTVFTAIEGLGIKGAIVIPFDGQDILSGIEYKENELVELSPYACLFIKKNQ